MGYIKYNETPDYQYINILGKEGVFTPANIQTESMPEGFHKYTLLSGDASMFGAITPQELPDSEGTFVTKTKLDVDGEFHLDEADWSFVDKDFDFESFFGQKLALDTQVEMAEAKRDAIRAEKQQAKHRGKNPAHEDHDMGL